MSVDENASYQFHFTYKKWLDHIKGVFSKPFDLVRDFLGVIAACWFMLELVVYFAGIERKPVEWSVLVLVLSVILTLILEIKRYYYTCPVGFERLSIEAQRLAHLQTKRWEPNLVKSLLAQKLSPLDIVYKELLNDEVLVAAEPPQSIRWYLKWIESRSNDLIKMVHISTKLMVHKLPKTMDLQEGEIASPDDILVAVESIERFYKDTIEFEKRSRTIFPPEPFRKLHELQFGWTKPIRDAIEGLFRNYQILCEAELDSDTPISLEIIYPAVSLDEYFKEQERIKEKLPNLIEELEDF